MNTQARAVGVFALGVATFASLDAVWLGVVMRGFYRDSLAPLARTGADGTLAPIWAAAVPVYVLLALGVLLFVLPRATSAGGAAAWGALSGFLTYGVYDLTNLATLRGYSGTLTVVDMAWGAVATAITAAVMRAASSNGARPAPRTPPAS